MAATLAVSAGPAAATTLPSEDFPASCPTQSPSGDSYGGVRICSGEVPSFDGAPMDIDVTQPEQDTGTRHPLIIMLHGFGNNKHEWESRTDAGDDADKWHWNNRWFARHGYYVLTYTARGFRDDGPTGNYQPNTPASTTGSVSAPNGTIHLKSRDWEIRDTQWLAALVAATYSDVDPNQIAVTGGSYGGIESWLQASQAEWTFPHEQDSTLPEKLQLQVAVPKYPSTDLAYSLAPNGHGGGEDGTDVYESSQGQEDSDVGDGHPFGVGKESWVSGLFAVGTSRGVFETGSSIETKPCTYDDCEGPISIDAWQVRATAGDPYDTCEEQAEWTECYDTSAPDPVVVKQIRRGLTEFRGSYYQEEGWDAQADGRKVAIFSIQGWTDDLFPAVESFRQFKSLKRRDSRWPVEVEVADVGHSRAQNKPATWHRLNDQAFQFLQSQIGGSHDEQTTVASEATTCPNDGEAGNDQKAAKQVTGSTPEELANGTLTVQYPGGFTVNPLGVTDPNGLATDAVLGPTDPCRTSNVPALGGYTAFSPPLRDTTTYVGIGTVKVPYTAEGTTTTATLSARLWDQPPGKRRNENCSTDRAGARKQDKSDGGKDNSGELPNPTDDTTPGDADKDDRSGQLPNPTDDATQGDDGKDDGLGQLPVQRLANPTDDATQGDDGSDDSGQVPNPTDDTTQGDAGKDDSGQVPNPTDTTTQGDAGKDDSGQLPSQANFPTSCALLITRGTYRVNHLSPAYEGVLELPLYGNHWRLKPGHQIRLDLTEVDEPTYQPSKPSNSFQFVDGVTLTLPTLESSDQTLDASADQFPPFLPDLSKVPDDLAKAVEKVVGEVVGTIDGVTGTVDDITGKGKDVTDKTEDQVEGQPPSGDKEGSDGSGEEGGADDGAAGGSDNGGGDDGSQAPDVGVP